MTAADLDLEALREVVDAGTDLPWEAGETQHFADSGYHVSYADVEPNICAGADPADAALIVAAVNALPVLLDRVAELEAKLEMPCGSCHPCNDWAAETWRRAGGELPHKHTVDGWKADRDTAEAEVTRLTAVVQGVRELADEFRDAWTATHESAQRMGQTRPDRPELASYWVGKADGYSKAVYRLRALAGGTDTPKGEGE